MLMCTLSYVHFGIEEESTKENFSYEKSEIEEDNDLKIDCKLFYNMLKFNMRRDASGLFMKNHPLKCQTHHLKKIHYP